MVSKKNQSLVWKALAVFGGIVAAAMVVRSKKTADASGVAITDALKSEVTSLTSFK